MIRFSTRLPQIAAAFILTVVSAASVGALFAASAFALENVFGGGQGDLSRSLHDIGGLFLVLAPPAALYVFVLSIPVIAATALTTEWRGWRSMSFYLGAGVAASLPMAADFFNEPGSARVLALAPVCAGLAGGFAYWRVAGRNAGPLRE